MSVAAKKGTILAGETEPVVRLRSELLQSFGGLGLVESVGRAFSVGRVGRSRLPYGNFWLPLGNWAHLPTHRSQFMILEVPREVKGNCGPSAIGLNIFLPTALLPRVTPCRSSRPRPSVPFLASSQFPPARLTAQRRSPLFSLKPVVVPGLSQYRH